MYKWQGDKVTLRATLKMWLCEPEVKEALFIASPSLVNRLDCWLSDPESKKGKKIEQSLTKYFIRMHSRCTPFGTFSGVATGEVTNRNSLALKELSYRRKSRLDMLIPFQLKKKVWRDKQNFLKMDLTANSTIYQLDDKLRYIESQSRATAQLYSLASINNNEYIEYVLELCSNEAQVCKIIEKLKEFDPELIEPEIEQFLWELVEEDVLEISMPLALTDAGNIDGVIDYCQKHGLVKETAILKQCERYIGELDKHLGQDKVIYEQISKLLTELPIDINENTSIQTDLWYETTGVQISQTAISKLLNDVSDLAKLSLVKNQMLNDFKEKFVARYECHAIPLLEALDDESGIGFARSSSINSPILHGIAFNHSSIDNQYTNSKFDDFLSEKIYQSSSLEEISITRSDVKALAIDKEQQIPPSFYLSGSLLYDNINKAEGGNFSFELKGLGGPSAANVLGRFCHLDNNLLAKTRAELSFEQSMFPSAILAEIVHFPEGKIGNVIARPKLRDFEIPFLADSSVSDDNQIPLKDLHVFVQNDRVVLWSTKHNKEVIPRLSCAHNTRDNSLGIYTFLASLQSQNGELPHFKLPYSAQNLSYIPRIRLGNLILSPRTWHIPIEELKALVSEFSIEKSHAFQKRLSLPKFIIFKDYDQKLLIDLDNILSVSALLSSVNREAKNAGSKISLEENLQNESQAVLTRDSEAFVNEIILPMRNPAYQHTTVHYPSITLTNDYQAKFMNGDQWLCCKIYCGQLIAEEILVNNLSPWINKKFESGQLENFFFLRFADPERHIRLRLNVKHVDLTSSLLEELNHILKKLFKEKKISDVNWISYTRETERYGGRESMVLAERIFTADSLAVLSILEKGLPDDLMWKVSILGCNEILEDFNLSIESILMILGNLRSAYGEEFNEDTNTRLSLGKKYRDEKESLYQLLEGETNDELHQDIIDVFAARSKVVSHTIHEITLLNQRNSMTCSVERVVASFLHMHTNRLLKGNGRQQELCIYDFLLKYYKYKKLQNREVVINNG
ncbi:hypothetical protein GCM10009128_24770 [Psychrosphaera haliotis]